MAIIKTTGLGTLKDSLLFDSTSNGIHLGVTSATASNLLDDYEEGSWTPIYEGASSNPTITYDGFTNGSYNKIGNVVIARGYIRTDSVSGGSGGLKLAGFPFNFSSQAYGASISISASFGWTSRPIFVLNDSNTDTVNLYDINGSGYSVTDLGTGSNSNAVAFTAVYQI